MWVGWSPSGYDPSKESSSEEDDDTPIPWHIANHTSLEDARSDHNIELRMFLECLDKSIDFFDIHLSICIKRDHILPRVLIRIATDKLKSCFERSPPSSVDRVTEEIDPS